LKRDFQTELQNYFYLKKQQQKKKKKLQKQVSS